MAEEKVTRFGEVVGFNVEGWTTEDVNSWRGVLQAKLTQRAFGALEDYANECAASNAQSMNLLTQEGIALAVKKQGLVMGLKLALEFLTELGTKEEEQKDE